MLGIVVALLALPIGSAVGQVIAGTGTSHVLATDSSVEYAIGQGNGTAAKLPFAVVNGTATVSNGYYARITNSTGVVTGYKYFPTVFLETNLSLANMNDYAINTFVASIAAPGNITEILGAGIMGNASMLAFDPIASHAFAGNASKFLNYSFSLSPAYLTGPQNYTMILELQFNSTSVGTFGAAFTAIGKSSVQPWYLAGENSAYAFAGLLLFGFAFMTLPFHDFSITKMKELAPKRTKRKPSNSRRYNAPIKKPVSGRKPNGQFKKKGGN